LERFKAAREIARICLRADVSGVAGRLVFVQFADVMLGVELEPQLLHEIELRLQEIDVTLFVGHQLLEEIA
jgi:hypothetical protein